MFTLEGWAKAANHCLGDFPSCNTYQRLLRELDRDPIPISITISAPAAQQFLDRPRRRSAGKRTDRTLVSESSTRHAATSRHLANQAGNRGDHPGTASAPELPGAVQA